MMCDISEIFIALVGCVGWGLAWRYLYKYNELNIENKRRRKFDSIYSDVD